MEYAPHPATIGGNRLVRRGKQLVVCSNADMESWQVQQIRKTAIRIQDSVWCLVGKQYVPAKRKEVRYFLEPWPDFEKEIPGRIIRYDDEYVFLRDKAEKKRKMEALGGLLLYPLRAVIGFLPSRVKSRLEEDFGVPARSATFISIIIELLLFVLFGAFLQIFTYASMRAPNLVVHVPICMTLTLITLIDVVMRFHSYLREDASPWGFFEWILPKRRR